jgi:hypothetical protein
MRLQDLAGIAIIFVVVAIVISIGSDVLTEVRQGEANYTVKYNTTKYGLEGLEELASWLPTIAIVVVAAVVIGIIALYFAVRG